MLLVATAKDRLQISSQLDGRRNKMPTINENQFFTVLVEWGVDPSQQQAFVDAIADLVEQQIENDTGFVSASFHASEDGQRVINYAQWRSNEDWSRSRSSGDDEATTAMAEVISRCGAKTLTVEPFRVLRVVEHG
jgi:quinol monooxygenase YgiN